MTETFRFTVLLELETSDPRLTEAALMQSMGTARGVATVRRAVLHHLPKDVRRVIAVLPIEQAMALLKLHEEVARALLDKDIVVRPPADYVPPVRG